MLTFEGVSALGVTSGTSKDKRVLQLESIRSGDARILVATQLADEGLDLPLIDCLINCSAGKSAGLAKQRVGRALRVAGREPVVFELVDSGEFESQWRKRERGYRAEYGGGAFPVSAPVLLAQAIRIMHASSASEDGRESKEMCGF